MDLHIEMREAVAVLRFNGRFDANEASRVNKQFEQLFNAKTRFFLCNLSEVDFLDSTAMGILVTWLKRCRAEEGDVVLCGLQSPVKIIFELSRLDHVFKIYDDEVGAYKAIAAI